MKKRLFSLYRRRDWVSVLIFLLLHQTATSQTPTISRIGTLGGFASTAYAVNSTGYVVGDSYTAGDVEDHAFLFSGGVITDLGTLGGTFSAAFGINKTGQVVGYSGTTGDAATHAFLFSNGTMTSLGTLGGRFSSATAINDAGQIIGHSTTANNLTHAFLYSGGVMTDLGTLGGAFSTATALNSVGAVAGRSSLANQADDHAFLWRNGVLRDLGTLGGTSSSAAGLNDSGWVVGASTTSGNLQIHAFLFDGSVLRDLGTLGGGYSVANAINNSGQVAGDSYPTGSTELHAFLYANGRMLDLGTLGGSYSRTYGLNRSGLIVGESATVDGFGHAFLWENGVMTDLNTLITPESGWELLTAYEISDGGHIVGIGYYFGLLDWFLLSLNRSANNPPVANAGPDQTAECAGDRTNVLLDGTASTDPDGDALNYKWYLGDTLLGTGATLLVSVTQGSHTITLRVTDPGGETAEDSLNVNVVDTTPPSVTCPQPITLSTGEGCQAAIPDLLAQVMAADNCSPAASLLTTQNPAAGTLVGFGTHTVEVTVTDPAGNRSTCVTSVSVRDATAPVIASITATPAYLWPANRHMVEVTLTVSASDNCDRAPASRIIAIHSNEPVTDLRDDTSPDWSITGPLTANLRAENSKDACDRIYTLTIECTDASGNRSTATVRVPVGRQRAELLKLPEKNLSRQVDSRRQKATPKRRI